MVAIESVFQVNVGLPDKVVKTHEVMIKHSHSQLWLSRERNAELQDPGQEGEQLKTPPYPGGGLVGAGAPGVSSASIHSLTITTAAA